MPTHPRGESWPKAQQGHAVMSYLYIDLSLVQHHSCAKLVPMQHEAPDTGH